MATDLSSDTVPVKPAAKPKTTATLKKQPSKPKGSARTQQSRTKEQKADPESKPKHIAKPFKAEGELVRKSAVILQDEHAFVVRVLQKNINPAKTYNHTDVLRAGLAVLHALSDEQVTEALAAVTPTRGRRE